MKRIESFCVNHNKLKKGLYLSRVDGDAVTYDLRMAIPNSGTYLENDGIHTFEHLFATYARNSAYSDRVIYVGPMGCRTGFYFIVRDTVTASEVIGLLQKAMDFIAGYEGEIPGVSPAECGNYRDMDLEAARRDAAAYVAVLETLTDKDMRYKA